MFFPSLLIAPVCVRARRYFAGLGLLGLAFAAQASVVITGTRIIYPAPAREVSVQIKNVGAVPALVQVWLDRGDDSAQPGSAAAQTPFLLTPPIARLEPKRGQTIRLVYSAKRSCQQTARACFTLTCSTSHPSRRMMRNRWPSAICCSWPCARA